MSIEHRIYNEKLEENHTCHEGKGVYNFSPGPCILPRVVMDQVKAEMIDYEGTGQSVMELSHRKPQFLAISQGCKDELR